MNKTKLLFATLCIFLATILFSPKTAFALDIDRPADTNDTINTETFMCYEEFLQFFNLSGRKSFNLKDKFKPYHEKILKERFYDKIYRLEGETYNYFDFALGDIELPVYAIGQIYFPYKSLPLDTKGDLLNGFRSELWLQFGFAIGQEENFNYDSIKGVTILDSGYMYIIVLLESKSGEYNEDNDIGIAIKTKLNLHYDSLDYTYPTEAEYLAMYSNSKPKATTAPKVTKAPKSTATPIPTATPTPEPTATPVPTAAPTPEPTIIPVPTVPQPDVEVETTGSLRIILCASAVVALILIVATVIIGRKRKK